MEDYTYNLVPGKEGILEAHMLEVCPSVADGKVSMQVCSRFPWEIVKILQDWYLLLKTGPGIATSLVDLGDRFRLLINEVECKKTEKPMPAASGSVLHSGHRSRIFPQAAEAWILAGGAHHTAFTYDLTAEQMGDWADRCPGHGRTGTSGQKDPGRCCSNRL